MTPQPASVWSDVFEPRPRFAGCPPICLKTNLPSFQSEPAARKWVSEGCEIVKIGACGFCKHFHVLSRAADLSYLPLGFIPFLRRPEPGCGGRPRYGTADHPLHIDWKKIERAMAEREIERSMPL
jgi:hypothetical protein